MAYRRKVEDVTIWYYDDNSLSLNVNKTIEIIVDFREIIRNHIHNFINGSCVDSFRFLGLHITPSHGLPKPAASSRRHNRDFWHEYQNYCELLSQYHWECLDKSCKRKAQNNVNGTSQLADALFSLFPSKKTKKQNTAWTSNLTLSESIHCFHRQSDCWTADAP